MTNSRNYIPRKPKGLKKKKGSTESIQNVISLKINDDEKRTLEKLTKTTSKSIPEIFREAIELWISKRRKLCLD